MRILPATFIFCIFTFTQLWAAARRPPEPPSAAAEAPSPEPMTLWEAYELALKRSETLAIRKEEIERTEADRLEAAGEAIGDASFVIDSTYRETQKGGGDSEGVGGSLTAAHRRERRFVLSQPIFQGFRTLGALSGAGSLRRQRQKEWERAKQLLFLDVVNAYYTVLKQKRDVETIEGIHRLFEERIGDLNERVEIGRSRSSEISTATSRMKILEAELAKSQGELAVAIHLLEFLTGIPISAGQLLDENPHEPPLDDADIERLAAERFDVEAARQAVKTARGGFIVAQSELWPDMSVDANFYEKREGFQSGIDWDLLFKIDVPLGKGGTTLGEMKDAKSVWKQAQLNYSMVQRQATREIKDAHQNWKSTAARHRSLEEAVRASEENYQFQKEEYTRNLVGNLDVLEALQSLLETRRDSNQAFYEMKGNSWELEVAKGNCCASF